MIQVTLTRKFDRYGFAADKDGGTVFICPAHCADFDYLTEGDRLTCEIANAPKGPMGLNVKKVKRNDKQNNRY